jgi:hypothetical protein
MSAFAYMVSCGRRRPTAVLAAKEFVPVTHVEPTQSESDDELGATCMWVKPELRAADAALLEILSQRARGARSIPPPPASIPLEILCERSVASSAEPVIAKSGGSIAPVAMTSEDVHAVTATKIAQAPSRWSTAAFAVVTIAAAALIGQAAGRASRPLPKLARTVEAVAAPVQLVKDPFDAAMAISALAPATVRAAACNGATGGVIVTFAPTGRVMAIAASRGNVSACVRSAFEAVTIPAFDGDPMSRYVELAR